MGATYRYYKCVHCKGVAQVKRVFDGLELGVPFYKCQKCWQQNYDKNVLEAALLSPESFIKAERKRYNTSILLTCYFGFGLSLMMSILLGGFLWGFLAVGIPAFGLLLFILQKRRKVTTDKYENDIQKSMVRLEQDTKYALTVIYLQRIGRGSAWEKKYGNQMEVMADKLFSSKT